MLFGCQNFIIGYNWKLKEKKTFGIIFLCIQKHQRENDIFLKKFETIGIFRNKYNSLIHSKFKHF